MNNYTYKATSFEITQEVKEYLEKKLEPFFKKYDILDLHMNIELGKTTNHHKNGDIYFAEARFQSKNGNIYAQASKEDIHEAIDHLESELAAQLSGAKGKRIALFKKGASKIKKLLRFDFS